MISEIAENGIIRIIPEMKTYHFHVSGTLDTDDLTPPTGKRICVYAVSSYTITITVQTNLTIPATLSFGTGAMTDPNKIIVAGHKDAVGDCVGGAFSGIRLIGEVDEIIRLTNMTYTVGTAETMINIFYQFI